jgi:hypothetical protein
LANEASESSQEATGQLKRIHFISAAAGIIFMLLAACAAPEPPPYSGTLDTSGKEAVDACIADLKSRLGPNTGEIILISYEPTIWRDTSLGISEQGKTYTPAVTPGAVVVLRTSGRSFTYHAGRISNRPEVKLAG